MDSTFRLIRVPAIITLAVTLLRLVGELSHWSKTFFNAAAGGGGAIVGIAWLVPIFGIYFAVKLSRSGASIPGGPTIAAALVGAVVFVAVAVGGMRALGLDPQKPTLTSLVLFTIASVAAMAVLLRLAPVLGKVMFAYGLAARIPVLVVMLVAMIANWGTHYDVAPPNFPVTNVFAKWFLIGVLPQIGFWIAFTMILGCLFGGIASLFVDKPAARTA